MLDLIFAIDCSGSIGERDFDIMINFVKSLVNLLPTSEETVHISVVTFSTAPKIEFYLNTYNTKSEVLSAMIDIMYIRGSTDTAGALRLIRESVLSPANGERPDVRDVLILLTDGESDDNEATLQEARLLRAQDVHIMTFGIGTWYNEQELQTIASYPYQSNMIHVESFNNLQDHVLPILAAVCDSK